MRKLYRTVFAALLSITLCLPQAKAWHAVGHMAVAYVAWQGLTPKTRTRVTSLLKKNPYYSKWSAYIPKGTSAADRKMYIFMMAATWPDEIKASGSGYTGGGAGGGDIPPKDMQVAARNTGYTDKDMHKYWHFVDTPFTTDGSVLPPLPVPSAQTEIALFRTTLASKASDKLKSYDLVWIEHLIGDVHQPLHCVTRMTQGKPKGDAGGNAVQITGEDNLHSYWDEVPGTGDTSGFMKAAAYAKTLDAAPAALAAETDEAAWVRECVDVAESKVYVSPIGPGFGPYTLTDEYKTQADAVARQQIALAGARLARLLNSNLR